MDQFCPTLKKKSKANPFTEGVKLGTDERFEQNAAQQQVMKRIRYWLGSEQRMKHPCRKKWKTGDGIHKKDKTKTKTKKTTQLLLSHGKTHTSSQAGSSGSAEVSSQSQRAARRPARSAQFPDCPKLEPRARAQRIPPPSLPRPMRTGVVIRHCLVSCRVTTSPRPLTQPPPGSEKMAKVSELYDVTWEGNCGRGGRGETESRRRRFGSTCCPRRPGFSDLCSALVRPSWGDSWGSWLRWRWRWRLTPSLVRPLTGVCSGPHRLGR